MQTRRLWFIFDPWSQGAGSDHTAKKREFDSVIKLTPMGVFHTSTGQFVREKNDLFQQDQESTYMLPVAFLRLCSALNFDNDNVNMLMLSITFPCSPSKFSIFAY